MTQFENSTRSADLGANFATSFPVNRRQTAFYIDDILAAPAKSSNETERSATPSTHGATIDEDLNLTNKFSSSSFYLPPSGKTALQENQSGSTVSSQHSLSRRRRSTEDLNSYLLHVSPSSRFDSNTLLDNSLVNSDLTLTHTPTIQLQLRDVQHHLKKIKIPPALVSTEVAFPHDLSHNNDTNVISEVLSYSKPSGTYDISNRVSGTNTQPTILPDSRYFPKALASAVSIFDFYPYQRQDYGWFLDRSSSVTKGRPYLLETVVRRGIHRRKGGQVRFSNNQTTGLEKKFNEQKYLSPPERKSIAKTLQLSERQIKTWFQNRRAKWRKAKQDEGLEEKECEFFQQRKQENVSREDVIADPHSLFTESESSVEDRDIKQRDTSIHKDKHSINSNQKEDNAIICSHSGNSGPFSSPLIASTKKAAKEPSSHLHTQPRSNLCPDTFSRRTSSKSSFERSYFPNQAIFYQQPFHRTSYYPYRGHQNAIFFP